MTLQEFQSTIKYNPAMLDAFLVANNIDLKTAMEKAEKEYNNRLAGRVKKENTSDKILKVATKKKTTRTPAQKRAAVNIKDRMRMAKDDMIGHIKMLISSGEVTYNEVNADPTVWFDKQIMGVYYNNYIIRQAIIRYFENEFIPF